MSGDCPSPEGLLIVMEDAARLGVHVAYATACGPATGESEAGLEDEIREVLEWARRQYTLDKLREDPVVKAYRSFYWRIGIDPTKTRPSAEALLRRALRGRWPRILPLVDAGNIASARTLVPIGLYDLDRLDPPAMLKVSRGGEVFRPIGGRDEILPGGIPILVDNKGRVLHLYPHRDSRETMITPSTTRMLMIAAGVPGVDRTRLRLALELLSRLLEKLGWRASRILFAP